MIRTARRERPLARADSRLGHALWPLAVAGLFALREPRGRRARSRRSGRRARPAAAKAAAKPRSDQARRARKHKPSGQVASPQAEARKAKAKSRRQAEPRPRQPRPSRAARPESRGAAAADASRRPAPTARRHSPRRSPRPCSRRCRKKTAAAPQSPPAPATAPQPLAIPPPANTIITAAAIDVAAVKRAIELVRNRKQTDANEVKKQHFRSGRQEARRMGDPAQRRFRRRFRALRRLHRRQSRTGRASSRCAARPRPMAFQEQADDARGAGLSSRSSRRSPPRAASRYARALLAAGRPQGRRGAGARGLALRRLLAGRRKAGCYDTFGEFLTRADHKARMDRRLYEKDDTEAGLRAAARLGGNEPAIAKARIAMLEQGRQQGRCSTPCRPPRATTSATSSPASRCCAAPTSSPRPWR